MFYLPLAGETPTRAKPVSTRRDLTGDARRFTWSSDSLENVMFFPSPLTISFKSGSFRVPFTTTFSFSGFFGAALFFENLRCSEDAPLDSYWDLLFTLSPASDPLSLFLHYNLVNCSEDEKYLLE